MVGRGDEPPVAAFTSHAGDFLCCGPMYESPNFFAAINHYYDRVTWEDLPFTHCGVRVSRVPEGLVLDQMEKTKRIQSLDVPVDLFRVRLSRRHFSTSFGLWWARFCLWPQAPDRI